MNLVEPRVPLSPHFYEIREDVIKHFLLPEKTSIAMAGDAASPLSQTPSCPLSFTPLACLKLTCGSKFSFSSIIFCRCGKHVLNWCGIVYTLTHILNKEPGSYTSGTDN